MQDRFVAFLVTAGCLLALAWPAAGHSAEQQSTPVVTVAREGKADFVGDDQRPILAAIERLRATGGTVRIGPGEYLVRSPLRPPSNLTIQGAGRTVLRLPRPVTVDAASAKGDPTITVSDASELSPDTSIQVCPPAGAKVFADCQKPFITARIREIKQKTLVLAEPLPCAVPAQSRAGYAHNLLDIRQSPKNITVEHLTLDGGRTPGIAMPGHVKRCAILAHGIYSYEKGPSGPPIENLRVVNCHIRNCYGRAVAMYSVVRAKVEGCLVENIADEAIDLDHFCYHCEVTGNEIKRAVIGVTINDGSYCTVQHNRITDCGVGIIIWWWHRCPQENIDVENVIRHNFIYAPRKAAISLGKRCFRNQVLANFVQGKIVVAEPDNVVRNNTEL